MERELNGHTELKGYSELNGYKGMKVAVVIPYYRAATQLPRVIGKLPVYIAAVIIVDDQSPEPLPKEAVEQVLPEGISCHFLENPVNLGVGGATKTGFTKALELDMDVVIKVDADDQMDLRFIPSLLDALEQGSGVQMAKGNRFRDFKALRAMPSTRKFGNLGLSFLIKVATGYWNNFDPTNGFLAIKTSALRQLDFDKLANRYYFETSLLAELYFIHARVRDIPMPAIYGDEKSNMNVWKMPFLFGRKLSVTFFKRIIKSYFLYDFNIGSIYILFGLPLFLFGVIYGIYEWISYASADVLAPTGTIMLITLSIILGFQLLLQAIQYDIIQAPKVDQNS